MHLSELLFQCADALDAGDALLPELLVPMLDEAREKLDDWASKIESEAHPPGLEGFDQGFAEVLDGYFEVIDLLELAVLEDVPELAATIKCQIQDVLDILRDIKDRAESHYDMLSEELIARS